MTKKVLSLAFILCMLISSYSYALISPNAISDIDFLKANYYTADYTLKNIQVGETLQSYVGFKNGWNEPSKQDVYELTILEDSMVTIKATPLNEQYYTHLKIDALIFVDEVAGQKNYYSASDQKNGIGIDDFGTYGAYYRSVYLNKGTYYFQVTGQSYTSEEHVSNYLSYVDYQIEVTSTSYQNEPNGDTDQSNSYSLKSNSDILNGTLRMETGYTEGLFRSDSADRIIIPAGSERDITLKIHNIKSNPLEVFKKELEYTRNNDNKKALELNTLTNVYKAGAQLNVGIKENGNHYVLPSEFIEVTFTAMENEEYYIDLSANFPTQYKIDYTESIASGSTDAMPNSTTVKPIVMVHTACDIDASVFDNRNYKIFVNDIDYTDQEGYMGHITNLPESNVGDAYDIRIEVEGYKPYFETVTIPAGEDGSDNAIVFVNVSTTAVNQESFHIYGYLVEQVPYYDGALYNDNEGSLEMVGGQFTNNRVSNGRRDGNGVITKEKQNLLNKRIYTSYTIYGDEYAYFAPGGVENVYSGFGVTTGHSYNGTKVVQSGVQLFQIIGVSDTSYYKVVTTGNYFGMEGSQIVMEESGMLSEQAQQNILQPQSIQFIFGDNYGGTNTSLKIHYLSVEPYAGLEQLRGIDTEISFTDVSSNHWAYDYILYMADRDIVNGYEDGTFRPDASFSRAAFSVLMFKSFELDSYTGSEIYAKDVPTSHWAYPFFMGSKEYLTTYTDGLTILFKPDEPAEREDVAVAMVKAMELDLSEADLTQLDQFTDKDQISENLRPHVALAVEYGIMNGMGEGIFSPKSKLTRAQACTLFARFIQNFKTTESLGSFEKISN